MALKDFAVDEQLSDRGLKADHWPFPCIEHFFDDRRGCTVLFAPDHLLDPRKVKNLRRTG